MSTSVAAAVARSDAALTQPIDDTVSIDTNGEEMTVYVVPDVPLN